MQFFATCVTNEETDGVALVGFADNKMNPSQYVLLQRTLTPTPQDMNCGFDKLYIEVNSQLHSGYGAVRTADFQRDMLVLRLDQKLASNISVDSVITIRFDLSIERFKEIAEVFGQLAAGGDVQVSILAQ
jgi:hypothetical protein